LKKSRVTGRPGARTKSDLKIFFSRLIKLVELLLALEVESFREIRAFVM
jgi:hypothetical protein